jgi:hypothetical protein
MADLATPTVQPASGVFPIACFLCPCLARPRARDGWFYPESSPTAR